MNSWREDAQSIVRNLRFVAGCIEYYQRMTLCHDCNDCSRSDCKYKPGWGEQVRVNCPLWRGDNDGKK